MSKFFARRVSFPAGMIAKHGVPFAGRRNVSLVTRLVSLAVFLAGLSANSRADTLYVDDDAPAGGDGTTWATAFTDLQDALAAATSGDEIRVAHGTYAPSDCDDAQCLEVHRAATFQLKNGVMLVGGYAGLGAPDPDLRDITLNETILSGDLSGNDALVACQDDSPDCDAFGGHCDTDSFCIISNNNGENSYHVVTGSDTDSTAMIDGFTIESGNANGAAFNATGGGIANSNSSPTIANCVFTRNAAERGAGMYNSASNPTIMICRFIANATTNFGIGGGMFNSGASPTVTDCSFTGNFADAGGGIYNDNFSGPVVVNCTFSGNRVDIQGGGMYNSTFFANPTVINCTFSGNVSMQLGAGMSNDGSACPEITNCAFVGNSAGTDGGGMHNWPGSTPTVTNCIFNGNSAHGDGGGMRNRGGNPIVANCSFLGNSANHDGGGMFNGAFNGSFSNPVVSNSVFWQNSDAGGMDESAQVHDNEGSTSTVNHSDVQGDWTGEGGIGNIDADPLFIDANGPDNIPGTDDDDLRLGPGSPCIDAGDNSVVTVSPDLDGNIRIVDDPASPDCPQAPGTCGTPPIVDMGAYEFGSMSCGLADLDCDGDVDLHDFAGLQRCFGAADPLACNPAVTPDLDSNGQVEVVDYALFQPTLTGPK